MTNKPYAEELRRAAAVHAEVGNFVEAAQKTRQAIELVANAPILRLELGQYLERLADVDGATRSYFLAVMKARSRGVWFDESSVPPSILPAVMHAMAYVETHRDDVLMQVMTPMYEKFGKSELRRVTQALMIYLGRDVTKPASRDQRPLFLFVPGLREQPYYDSAEFAWIDTAKKLQPQIAAEARAALSKTRLMPFLGEQLPDASAYLGGTKPEWDAYFFFRHGESFPEHLAACPVTCEFLDQLPRIQIDGHAPEVCFSRLAPDTHILPHTGVSNLRIVAHLPLILPEHCAIKVAGIERRWATDDVLLFDDTFEHEAWNHATEERVILLMDTWHPDLREPEQIALSHLVHEIGRFNRG